MGEDFFEGLRQTLTETAEVVGKKTEDLIEIQKLRSRLRSAQREVQQEYQKIGGMICHRFVKGEVMDEELAQMCEKVMELQNQAARCKEELAGKKGRNICPACGCSNPKDASFCMHCGSVMPKEEPEEEDLFTAGPVKEQTKEEAEQEVWEACTEEETAAEEETETENLTETDAEKEE